MITSISNLVEGVVAVRKGTRIQAHNGYVEFDGSFVTIRTYFWRWGLFRLSSTVTIPVRKISFITWIEPKFFQMGHAKFFVGAREFDMLVMLSNVDKMRKLIWAIQRAI